jgi:hypothetical protein
VVWYSKGRHLKKHRGMRWPADCKCGRVWSVVKNDKGTFIVFDPAQPSPYPDGIDEDGRYLRCGCPAGQCRNLTAVQLGLADRCGMFPPLGQA